VRSMLRKEEILHQPIDMNEVVLDVLALMRSDLLNRQVTVHTELAAQLPAVAGDRVQLQQVLLNLLINACEALGDSKTQRDIVVGSESAPDGKVTVSVTDRGAGIPPDDLERIFAPFVTTKVQGMGLGLAVCRSIVKAHGGTLWARNNPTGGATLSVRLPAAEA
jgi:two-component system sensor kinase FixL